MRACSAGNRDDHTASKSFSAADHLSVIHVRSVPDVLPPQSAPRSPGSARRRRISWTTAFSTMSAGNRSGAVMVVPVARLRIRSIEA